MSEIEETKVIKISGVGVGVMILKDGKVLLGKRHHDPKKASSKLQGQNTWTMPGGKLDFGERLIDCACRETLEETGIVVDKQKLKIISVSDDINESVHFTTIGFLCENFEGEPQVMEPEVIIEWNWFDLSELPAPMYFPSQRILNNYLNGRVYDN